MNRQTQRMNRKERRQQRAENRALLKTKNKELTEVPHEEWPTFPYGKIPMNIWVSKDYLVQMHISYPDMIRLSVCRSKVKTDGGWEDGLTWDELMDIKRELGFGGWYGVEVYPRDIDIINIANFRHIWLMPVPLPIGWFGEGVVANE